MKAVDPNGHVCCHWRSVRAVTPSLILPVIVNLLDTLQELIPFDVTDLLEDASDEYSLAYAAFAGWFDDAERAGLITLREEVNCLHSIDRALAPLP